MSDVVRLFLLILTWEPDDSVSQRMMEVPICPPMSFLEREFKPMQEAGKIKSWVAFCLPAQFKFLEGKSI
tara:strand:- start:2181 stop:2390 length:210 start_codon:yes stop_codon:yes gene_type:complete